MHRKTVRNRAWRGVALIAAAVLPVFAPSIVRAQNASVSAWDAADFRIWGYIPYWVTTSELNSFDDTNGVYSHVSDVLYFGGYRPNSNGDINYASTTYRDQLTLIRSQMQTSGFKLHLSMFEVNGGLGTDATWQSIIADPAKRTNFVTQVKSLLQGSAGTADDLKGFNFDWERPATATEWGNYTQLARELRTAINPLGMEVSVCDYGSTDTDWDGTSLFDAKIYDQLMMMVYHIGATSSGSWANTKLALTGQGAAKAFSNDQITIGVGTWGNGVGTAPTKGLDQIVAVEPNLAYDALSYTGTIGSTVDGTWNIESRKQVREKTQLAIDRGMPGMFTWTVHYDAQNNLGLHRVMQHYMSVKKDIPDLDLNGKVDATDATALANNMGMVLTNTGTAAGAAFDAFYLGGNWEKGDRDGNGFVNQADANWLATRYAALGVNLPDRLAYSGTFESFPGSVGLTGRWRAGRSGASALNETSNFKQEAAGFLPWSGTGAKSIQHSNNFVTIRNTNASEVAAGANNLARSLQADLATNIDLAQNTSYFFTFLVRENTAGLSASQLASSNRTLALEFLNGSGVNQFDFTIRGLQQTLSIEGEADINGQDVSINGLAANSTYLVIGKIAPNGAGASTLQTSFFANGATVGDFTDPSFNWMLTAQGGAGFNPILTDLQFSSLPDANFTVSNVWIGTASTVPEPASVSLLLLAALVVGSKRVRPAVQA
jgi:hypothetical protein